MACCVECSAEFEPRKSSQTFCSKPCGKRNHNRRYRADGRFAAKIAEYGERRREQARGYNRKHNQACRVRLTCQICSAPWTADRGATRRGVRYCSTLCVAAARRGCWPKSDIPAGHPVRSTRIPDDHAARRRRPARFMQGVCVQCGGSFVADRLSFSNHSDRTCSHRCARAAAKARRRAMKRDAFVEPVFRARVFERDGWVCQLCGDPVDRDAAVPHPRAVTIDHVVPLARGGKHEMSNAQTACFLCNCLKSDSMPDDSAALVA